MRLTLITENNQILQQTAEKLKIPIDKLNQIVTDADPTGRKYKLFILKLLNKNSIRLPEDNYRVKETLNNFQKYQRNLEFKDILKYDSLHDLETAIEPFLGSISKRQGGNNLNPLSLPGVKLVLDRGEYQTYEVNDVEGLKDIGEGTKWCTRRSYPNCQAECYLQEYAWIGVVYKDNKPFIQFTSDYEQVMDVNDVKVDFDVSSIIPKPNLDDDYEILYKYACNVLKSRWYEIEPIMLEHPHMAYMYADHVIKGRWMIAEPVIARDPQCACYYARYSIKGRWPRAEPIIMKNAYYAYYYAKNIIGGRWLEAEPTIMKDPQYAYNYACDVIDDRWLEAEPYIAKDSFYSFNYIDRFPESEQTIDMLSKHKGE